MSTAFFMDSAFTALLQINAILEQRSLLSEIEVKMTNREMPITMKTKISVSSLNCQKMKSSEASHESDGCSECHVTHAVESTMCESDS